MVVSDGKTMKCVKHLVEGAVLCERLVHKSKPSDPVMVMWLIHFINKLTNLGTQFFKQLEPLAFSKKDYPVLN